MICSKPSLLFIYSFGILTLEIDFERHLKTLQMTLFIEREVDGHVQCCILDSEKLDAQSTFFMTTMRSHVQRAPWWEAAKEVTATTLWKKLSQGPHLLAQISEYAKLAKLVLVMIIGSVEDERTFSRLDYIKNKKRNSLDKHLDICVRAFEQNFYDLGTFPFNEAINAWNNLPMCMRYRSLCTEKEDEDIADISDLESEEEMEEELSTSSTP